MTRKPPQPADVIQAAYAHLDVGEHARAEALFQRVLREKATRDDPRYVIPALRGLSTSLRERA